jgi:hypothetical protein
MFFGSAKQTEKQPKQIEFRFVSVWTEKKFDCFEDTLVLTPLIRREARKQKEISGVWVGVAAREERDEVWIVFSLWWP